MSIVSILMAAAAVGSASPAAAAKVVDGQVAAYNSQNARAFAGFYALDAKVYDADLGEAPKVRGRAAIEHYYAALFRRAPGIKVVILSRLQSGGYVTDLERLSGTPITALVTYEVRSGLITRVWMHATKAAE